MTFYQEISKWTLSNLLPNKVWLYIETAQYGGYLQFLDTLKSHETKSYPCEQINEGDKLFVFDQKNGNRCRISEEEVRRSMVLQPSSFRDFQKYIAIGGTVYNEFDGARNVTSSLSDIAGFYIHNKMKYPLNIHFRGRIAAQIGSYDGKGYHGGSSSQIYFDNARQGVNLGDKIGFSYSFNEDISKNPFLYEVEINDTHLHNMNVGVFTFSDKTLNLNDDITAYKVQELPYTGVSYYIHNPHISNNAYISKRI